VVHVATEVMQAIGVGELQMEVYRSSHTGPHLAVLLPDFLRNSGTSTSLHTLRGEETTHMNSRIIITDGRGVPLSTNPSTILPDIWFLISYYFELG